MLLHGFSAEKQILFSSSIVTFLSALRFCAAGVLLQYFPHALIEQKIPGAVKAQTNRSEQEQKAIDRMNDRRWQAYRRTQGYTYLYDLKDEE